LDRDIPATLRAIADALDAGEPETLHPDVQGFGGPRHDPRAHLLVKFVLAAEIVTAPMPPLQTPDNLQTRRIASDLIQ
jgi:hypothetical protein